MARSSASRGRHSIVLLSVLLVLVCSWAGAVVLVPDALGVVREAPAVDRRTPNAGAAQLGAGAEGEGLGAQRPRARSNRAKTGKPRDSRGRKPRARGEGGGAGGAGARTERRAWCSKGGCAARATYASEEQDGSRRSLCAKHRESGSVALRSKAQACRHEGCTTWPSYGPAAPGSHVALRCRLHAERGDVNLKARRCVADGCSAQATFGDAGCKALYCKLHRMEHHVDTRSTKCASLGCSKQPSFVSDQEGAGAGLYCKKHRGLAHTIRPQRRCRHEGGCLRARTHGDAAGPLANEKMFCKDHKLPGQVDLAKAHCEVAGCQRRGAGHDASGSRRTCSKHTGENMGFAEGRCLHPAACSQKATYGDPENGVAVFCSEHRLSWHVDVSAWCEGLDPSFRDAKLRRGDIVSRLYSIPGIWQDCAHEAEEKADAGEEVLAWLDGVTGQGPTSMREELLGATAQGP